MMTAATLLKNAIVWDNVWPLGPEVGNDFNALEQLSNHGWSAVSLTLAGDDHSLAEAFTRIMAARRELERRSVNCVLARTAADIRRAKSEGRLALLLHLEGTRCFERNLDVVQGFFDLGVRHTLLAFNASNSAGGGCAEATDGGLTKFGRRLVGELERVGMLLDLSHTGRQTSLDALGMATQPAVFSHSNADAVAPHWRNLTDAQIKACAATGGLIGLSGSSGYLGDLEASTATMFRHLDYVVQLVGPDHVGMGFDLVFDETALNAWVRTRADEWPGAEDPRWPGFRYARPAQLEELVEMMLAHNYSEAAVLGFLGGNYLRIAEQLWG